MKKSNWVPETVKHGRFGKWLEGARDWNISRERFWGTPIPVWECTGCDYIEVLGSVDEIETKGKCKIDDLHKEHLDKIEFNCSKCDAIMKRVPGVLDCWFESGSMPYGQCHYPFENKKWFENHFPADFIVEYPGQIRGWFYYLHVLSTALFDKPSFKNCVVHGTLLAEDGSKISKSKKNYTDPMLLINEYGADAMRIYLMSSPAAAMQDLKFKDEGLKEQIKSVLLPLWNSYSFFVTYANINGFKGNDSKNLNPVNQLDKWVLARLYETEEKVRNSFDNYELNKTLTPVIDFIDDLTNWYIRRSRDRFWSDEMNQDTKEAFSTLYYVLTNLTKLLAPSTPFLSEYIFKELTGLKSVHLEDWPSIPSSFKNDNILVEFSLARKITNLGLSLRQKTKLKVKQPLREAKVALPKGTDTSVLEAQFDVI